MLSESQLLLLNNLIYKSKFTNSEYEGATVEKILEGLSNSKGQEMTSEEWADIYALVKEDETILNLTVNNMYYEEETGAKMACFVDSDGEAYAVFAGTGANEWRDDAIAALEEDSDQQVKALEWFEDLPYENITVSGHSKGANKAMYVAVVSDNVNQCYAYDGEGFSQYFVEKYADEIAEKKDDIYLIANYKDYVNPLLITIAGNVKYVVNDDGISNMKEYHSPNALFAYDENGNITAFIAEGSGETQDLSMKFLNEISVYILENATEAEKILCFNVLGELLTQYVGGDSAVVRTDLLDEYQSEGVEILLRYMQVYLIELEMENPVLYMKYKYAVSVYVGGGIGDDFWTKLLGYGMLSPLVSGTLFNNIILSVPIIGLICSNSFDSNGQMRDFSQEAMESMIGAAQEVQEEDWWEVTKWDCWYRVEKKFGFLDLSLYTGKVDTYYRKLIDVNDASVADIKKIFENVYALDAEYAGKIKEYSEQLETSIFSKIQKLNTRINSNNIELK